MHDINTSSTDPDAVAANGSGLKRSGLALAALILGIPGLCVTPLGVTALVLGIIALIHIANPQRRLTGRGMAIAGTVLGGTSIVLLPVLALLIGIMLPALGAARHSARNVVDMSNMRQIGAAMLAYAADNDWMLPEHPRDTLNYLGSTTPPRDIFISPHHDPSTTIDRGDSDGAALRYGSYVFLLLGTSVEDVVYPPQTIIAYTAKAIDSQQQRAVLFADGHAELIDEQHFRTLLPPDVDVEALDGP